MFIILNIRIVIIYLHLEATDYKSSLKLTKTALPSQSLKIGISSVCGIYLYGVIDEFCLAITWLH